LKGMRERVGVDIDRVCVREKDREVEGQEKERGKIVRPPRIGTASYG
jgi:hypothetical protein